MEKINLTLDEYDELSDKVTALGFHTEWANQYYSKTNPGEPAEDMILFLKKKGFNVESRFSFSHKLTNKKDTLAAIKKLSSLFGK